MTDTRQRKRRSERSRWVNVLTFRFGAGWNDEHADRQWHEVRAIVQAFEKVGRVVRVETNGEALMLRVRR